MLNGRGKVDKEEAELQFFILKRAIGEVLSGKHNPLFGKQSDKPMSKEENQDRFKSLLNAFNKKRGD